MARLAAETFADVLRRRQRRGQCDDDVLIFVSADDHAVSTSLGSVTGRYLTDDAVNAVTARAESYFKKGDYTVGIRYMINSYTTLLKGDVLDLSSDWKWPIPRWALITVLAVLLLIPVAVALFIVYRCSLYCRTDRRAEYTMGTRM
ncbi:unnamed protein product [Heligmosomoides polygyrus]|uniref:TPM_phosphatase domain-containing protein n=1 Tax=Heligmosomoides polygyrus TaxID=6339 RepID=A0A183G1M7_HELPZ|nr:unnamed protein product [Heligmosomoides polygyrus]